MASSAVVTGATGIGLTVTTKSIANVSEVQFDYNKMVLRIYTGGSGNAGNLVLDVSMSAFSSVACTVNSDKSHAWVIS